MFDQHLSILTHFRGEWQVCLKALSSEHWKNVSAMRRRVLLINSLFFFCSFSLIREVFLSNNCYVWFFMQSVTINPTTFSWPFKQWKFCQYEVNPLEGMHWMKCPCSINQHSCYVDGNVELYRYRSSGGYVVLDKLQFSF